MAALNSVLWLWWPGKAEKNQIFMFILAALKIVGHEALSNPYERYFWEDRAAFSLKMIGVNQSGFEQA
jgi:hypothetical protein